MSRRRSHLSALEKKQLVAARVKELDRRVKLCAKGKHIWRPSFISERLGSTPKWDGSSIHCEYCPVDSVISELNRAEQDMIVKIAKVLDEVNERVAQLCPRRTFSDSGI